MQYAKKRYPPPSNSLQQTIEEIKSKIDDKQMITINNEVMLRHKDAHGWSNAELESICRLLSMCREALGVLECEQEESNFLGASTFSLAYRQKEYANRTEDLLAELTLLRDKYAVCHRDVDIIDNEPNFAECHAQEGLYHYLESGHVQIDDRGVNVENVLVPKFIEIIHDKAFYRFNHLICVNFQAGSQLKHIYDFAFFKCPKLNTVVLPPSLEIIETNAFNECSNLMNLMMPDTLEANLNLPSDCAVTYYSSTQWAVLELSVGAIVEAAKAADKAKAEEAIAGTQFIFYDNQALAEIKQLLFEARFPNMT